MMYDRIIDSNMNVLPRLLAECGYELAKSAVRDVQEAILQDQPMSLGVLANVLDTLKVPYAAFRYSKKMGLPAGRPALVPVRTSSEPGSDSATYIFAIADPSGSGVPDLRNGHSEPLHLSASKWLRQWDGVALHLAPPPDDWLADRTELNAERASAAAFARDVSFVENLIDDDLCDDVIATCEIGRLFRRSHVSHDHRVSHVRTSFSTILPQELATRMERQLRRHAAFERLEFETFQVVRYRPGEQFLAHLDVSPEVRRPLTTILYLNDNFEGGNTSFPNVKRTWSPRKGGALIFPNLDKHDEPIEWSLHKAEQVTAGIKYACNIWVK